MKTAVATIITVLVTALTAPLAGELANLLTNTRETGIKVDLLHVSWILAGVIVVLVIILLQLRATRKRVRQAYGRGIEEGKSLRRTVVRGFWLPITEQDFQLSLEYTHEATVVHVPYDEEVEVLIEADEKVRMYVLKSKDELKKLLNDQDFRFLAGGENHSWVKWRVKEDSYLGNSYVMFAGLTPGDDRYVDCTIKAKRKELRRVA